MSAKRTAQNSSRFYETDLRLFPDFETTGTSDNRSFGANAMIICAERQRLLDCGGHALVIGGPGSGKTTIALMKALVRIKAGMLPGQSVLFLSFSRAAVARIAQASRLQLRKKDRALLNVQTFHSFFWDLLTTHAYLLGAPQRIRILMPQDERVLNGGIREEKQPQEWALWIRERERLFLSEGRIAFDLFAPKAALLGRVHTNFDIIGVNGDHCRAVQKDQG